MSALHPQRRGFATPRAAFAPDPARRAMLAKVHLAKKDLDLDDDDYRAILKRMTGETSSAKCSKGQLDDLLAEFTRMGFAARAKVAKGGVRAADHQAAKKARAMLISLGLLGVLRDTSEAALEAFARRQMGCEKLQWSNQAHVYKLIEALKAIAARHGWDLSTAGLQEPIWTLKYRLCEAIHAKLVARGALPATHRLGNSVVAELGNFDRVKELTERDLERLSAALGARLARAAFAEHYDD